MRSLRRSPAKHIDLLAQNQVFRLQRCSRLEARRQDTENQLEQIGHQDASLRRPLAGSTPNRIFGTHRRSLPGRVRLTNHDRWFFIQLYRWFPSILKVLTIIRPETLVRWHRAGFLSYWRWKSRPQGGRPQIDTELRVLIRRMSMETPPWGAPRIHGELLKLGFEVAQSSVAKYMVNDGATQPGMADLLAQPRAGHATMDLFVVPTIGFDLLYAFVIVRLV